VYLKLAVLGLIAVLSSVVGACSLTESTPPSGPTPSTNETPPPPGTTVGAPNAGPVPTIVSPAAGSETTEDRPTLTVGNVSLAGGTPTYSMDVATDSGFTAVVDRGQNIPQGSGGTTAWRVAVSLSPRQYFWRARASVGSTTTPFSSVADFQVRAAGTSTVPPTPPAPTPTPPSPVPPGAIIVDSLAMGSSGEVGGGQFTGSGWLVTRVEDFIRYQVPPIESGYVEWENTGLRSTNRTLDAYLLFGMWDPSRGAYRENPFRVHIQKLDANHNRPYVRLRWISEAEEHNTGFNFLDWDPSRVYRWRVEWGPEGSSNAARVFLDGAEVISQRYGPAYRPQVHNIELGVQERAESVIGAVYSNVRIGRR